MSVGTIDQGDLSGSHVKIGAASHLGRNLGVIAAIVLLGAGIAGFTMYSGKADAAKLETLAAFRANFAQKCEAPAWKNELPPVLRDTYLNSSQLQQVVATQQAALSGSGTCEDVLKALKAGDFPLPAPTPPPAQ
jgi:hypothetical protein